MKMNVLFMRNHRLEIKVRRSSVHVKFNPFENICGNIISRFNNFVQIIAQYILIAAIKHTKLISS